MYVQNRNNESECTIVAFDSQLKKIHIYVVPCVTTATYLACQVSIPLHVFQYAISKWIQSDIYG